MSSRLAALVFAALSLCASFSAAGLLLEPVSAQGLIPGRDFVPNLTNVDEEDHYGPTTDDPPSTDNLPTADPEGTAENTARNGPFGVLSNETDSTTDRTVANPAEWEQQVAADARGDVLLHWPGTVDLYYLTVGEVYAWSLGEPYMIVRIGYNATGPNQADVSESAVPGPVQPLVPSQIPRNALITVNLTFNVSGEEQQRVSFYSNSYGTSWDTNGGRLVSDRVVNSDLREIVYLAPLRRFGLEDGDVLRDFNVTAYREARIVDTMQAFEPLHDPLPRYTPAKSIWDGAYTQATGLTPIPAPAIPQPGYPNIPTPFPFPEPVPFPSTNPRDHIENDPYDYPPALGAQGIPDWMGDRNDWTRWKPTASNGDEQIPINVNGLADSGGQMQTGGAYNVTHRITDGQSRFIVRQEREIVGADFSTIGFANFSVESLFEDIDQTVAMLVNMPSNHRWAGRYGLDMPQGTKVLPGGDRVNMSFLAAPTSIFSRSPAEVVLMFLSDWGGLEVVRVLLVSTVEGAQGEGALPPGDGLPTTLLVDFVNENDPWRVNDVRNVMVQVRDGRGFYASGFTGVRAYIYPAGAPVPPQPYQLREKAWMDGIYEIPFVFDRAGAWVVDVHFFDYKADDNGLFPSMRYVVRVDYPGESSPIIPVPAALGSVLLIFAAVSVRERLAKAR